MFDAWTSTEAVVEVVLDFFNLVERRLSEIPADSERSSTNDLRSLFPQLARAVFRSFQERQDWLERYCPTGFSTFSSSFVNSF